MSALTPHIRVLRVEAFEFDMLAAEYESLSVTPERTAAVIIFRGLSSCKRHAAAALEAEEAKIGEDEHPITYNPKGKR